MNIKETIKDIVLGRVFFHSERMEFSVGIISHMYNNTYNADGFFFNNNKIGICTKLRLTLLTYLYAIMKNKISIAKIFSFFATRSEMKQLHFIIIHLDKLTNNN